ncbi:hypothetical protein AX17_000244 [Amanita inopinata Kibby_2008]|nr:hypothetical protein AX17_000244 [Amanita inopinata Kibby_2008]
MATTTAASSTSEEPQLRVQINQIDYVLEPPGELDDAQLHRVPVIRIFGCSSLGQTACVHVHQVYPYFYVEYLDELNPEHVQNYTTTLAHSLNHALAVLLRRKPQSRSQYVRAILLVKGVHFYGFHARHSPFLKIYFTDPTIISRAATIMQSGSVMATRFRVYESHLSFLLQFMCDFNLYGCGWIDLDKVYLRGAEDEDGEIQARPEFSPSTYHSQSRLPLEVDVIAPHILNRRQLVPRNLHHKLELPVHPSVGPLISSVRELWEDERRRRVACGLDPSPEMPVDPSESSRMPGGGWFSEERWREILRLRLEREEETGNDVDTASRDWEKWAMTTFESVEALWERQRTTWRLGYDPVQNRSNETLRPVDGTANNAEDNHVHVNVDMLSSPEMTDIFQLEEEGRREVGSNDLAEDNYEDEHTFDENEDTSSDRGEEDDELPQVVKTDDSILDDMPGPVDFTLSRPPESSPTRIRFPRRKTVESSTDENLIPLDSSHATTPTRQSAKAADPASTITPSPRRSITPPAWDRTIRNSVFTSYLGQEDTRSDCPKTLKRRKFDLPLHEADLPLSSESNAQRANQVAPTIRQYSYAAMKVVNLNRYEYRIRPPSISYLLQNLGSLGLSEKIYREPYYSALSDAPRGPRVYADLIYRLKGGRGVANLDAWESVLDQYAMPELVTSGAQVGSLALSGWEYASYPPSVKQVRGWLKTAQRYSITTERRRRHSQIEGPSHANMYGLGTSLGTRHEILRGKQHMTVLSLEVFAPSQGNKTLDPETDEIAAAFYTFKAYEAGPVQTGMIIVNSDSLNGSRIRSMPFEEVSNELDLLNTMADVVVNLDPDIITGWDVQRNSWGYVDARARQYGYQLPDLISRAVVKHSASENDQWGFRHTSNIRIAGRQVINAWRIVRSEQSLNSYTLENVAFHVLHRRIPHFSCSTLTNWYRSPVPAHSVEILRYFSRRTAMVVEILDKLEFVTKTAEFARIFGVDFFSIISRGSQFKVESFMFRIAKSENFVMLSPSKNDVGKQNAAECMPLVMEPTSAFYSSPLLVLDFQSLYPSVMIAYNYCYSTCLGRVTDFQGRNKFGVVNLDQPPGLLSTLREHINIAPNGMVYVKPEVRKGLLGRMLSELLETRIMVKQSMKSVKNDKTLHRILNARQLSLKYICNVTYGYTSATYSGRMPAVEIADSIVQSGRETLEKAITVINSTNKWGAQVVYGDTDSVFVYLPGKTKDQAFRIGNDIADTITALNPSPIKLKFEKVYHPCVLLAKKRYVGFKYESPDEMEPTFDAKGIETVRRDGVLAQQKMTEKCLKILFRSQDLSEIKAYCYRSWTKLLEDRASVRDFVFSKEVKMGTYSNKGPPPPGVMVAARRMILDPNSEPQYGERVPYVIIKGPPGSRLVDRAMDPLEFLQHSQLRLDAAYYITRVLIPPLERILNLVGADIRRWYNDMPKSSHLDPIMSPKKSVTAGPGSPSKVNIHQHFQNNQCVTCDSLALDDDLCIDCRSTPQSTAVKLGYQIHAGENHAYNSHLVCVSCTSSAPGEPIECDSLDCPWFFARKKAERQMEFLPVVEQLRQE